MLAHQHLFEDVYQTRSTIFVDPASDKPSVAKNLSVVSHVGDFVAATNPTTNVVICPWDPPSELVGVIDKQAYQDLADFSVIVSPQEIDSIPGRTTDRLVARILSELLPALHSFAGLLPGGNLKIAFHRTTEQSCPLFHVDRLQLRLLCTLRGPGTEWLSDDMVRRKHLGKGSNRKVMKHDAIVYEVDRFDLCILKGEKFPGNSGRGVVHRSPAVPPMTQGRWFVRVDFESC